MTSLLQYAPPTLSDFYTRTAIPDAPKHTGLLPLSDGEAKLKIPQPSLYASGGEGAKPTRIAEQIQYRHTNTPLNTVFFSASNMDNLQGQIKAAVLSLSKGEYVIDNQNEDDLHLIMRSYYLQYAPNNPANVAAELAELNERVVSFASNRIMVEIVAYKRYRKDILDFPDPIERPIDVKVYGTRTGELKSFF
jgi:hypothetical protein